MEKTEAKPKSSLSKYIPWHELLRRTFGEKARCPDCGGKLKLIALVKTEETIREILTAMHLPTGPPKVVKPRSPEIAQTQEKGFEWDVGGEGESSDWLEYPN